MTDNDPSLLERITDESRRSFLKKSAVATAGVGAAASGTASAQDGDDDIGANWFENEWKGLVFPQSFYPEARFTFVSGVVEWTPNYGDVQDSWFSDYNTRMIRWLNSGEQDQLFVAEDANIGEYDEELGFIPDQDGDDSDQPQVFEIRPEWAPFGDNQDLITVNFSPAEEETENQILDADDWWQDQQDAVDANGNGGGNGAGGNNTSGN
ncbi:twin-arginine translocation signal domain-containing protein [Natronoarchaeum rubrum]|uniref:twin-arginine translocation signal domain-containing protein n=1 Tax=Natronoarchaeum rubrum TaxID=755311 RepID=UPI0021134D2E|nr:twin-arginine translocation signal domain-containing protein [Natronoarchaeum rubrum]